MKILLTWIILSSLISGVDFYFMNNEFMQKRIVYNFFIAATIIVYPIRLFWSLVVAFIYVISILLNSRDGTEIQVLSDAVNKDRDKGIRNNKTIKKMNAEIYPVVCILTCLSGFLLAYMIGLK